jgi:hypothetical protein
MDEASTTKERRRSQHTKGTTTYKGRMETPLKVAAANTTTIET